MSKLLILSVIFSILSPLGNLTFAGASSFQNPKIYDNIVVWVNTQSDDSNIFMYNIDTKEKTQVTTNSSQQLNPTIYGTKIVWIDYRNGAYPDGGEVYIYDTTSKTENRVTTNASIKSHVAIYDNIIVWDDNRNGNWDIYMYDITSQEETQVTTNSSSQTEPAIYDKKIVWTDSRNGFGGSIYMYDIISKEETQVTNTQMGVSAEIYGDKIVYWDTKSGNADIYMYNITSGTESQITTNSSGQTEPAIYDNKIVWSDNRNGTDNWDIYMYDITTGTESPVISHPFSQSNSAIYGNKIVWQDWRNGYLDIYMVDTVSSSETRVTTDSNLNTAPTDITLSGSTIDENDPIGTMFGAFHTTDEDIGDIFTYSLVGGPGSEDNALFTIIYGYTLMTNFVPDYETKNMYSIKVRSTDSRGLFVEKQLIIALNDSNNETGDSSVINISTRKLPDKVIYNSGENLDLSGLIVTLGKTDGSMQDVAFANFKTYGITTSKNNGDPLLETDKSIITTINGHSNNIPITVKFGEINHIVNGWNSGKENLVIITHGWKGSANDEWVKNMQKNIYNNVEHSKNSVWTFDWKDGAATGDIGAPIAYNNAPNATNAGLLYNQIITLNPVPEHIHLIAHSAGSNVIQTVVDKLAEDYNKGIIHNPPSIHLTFLDAYVPYEHEQDRFGRFNNGHDEWKSLSGYAEQYVDTRLVPNIPIIGENGNTKLDGTHTKFNNAVNFDVTSLDKNAINHESQGGHEWPFWFYIDSIGYNKYKYQNKDFNLGFLFSEESINKVNMIYNHIGQWCTVTDISNPYNRCFRSGGEKPEVIIKEILTNVNQDVLIEVGEGSLIDVSKFVNNGGVGILPKIDIKSDIAEVKIPSDVGVVSSDPNWDGIIVAPKITDSGLIPKIINWKIGLSVDVGFLGGNLSFSKAVRILLPKQAGKIATYTRNGGNITEITRTCSADTQEAGNNLPFDGECKINVGNDLVIRTKHFTTFATYEEIPIVSSGGGGGGGGSTKDYCPAGDTSTSYYDNKCSNPTVGTGVLATTSTGIIETSTGATISGSGILDTHSTGSTFSGTTLTGSTTTDNSNTGLLDIITFSDIEDYFAKEDIQLLAKQKIISGFSDGTYRPNIGITRVEYLKMVLKSMNIYYSNTDTSKLNFSDVNKDTWEAKVIAKAIELKIIDGNNKLFKPNSSISRAESTKILIFAGGYKIDEKAISSFTDVTGWAVKYIEKAKELGIINGQLIDGKLIFRPLDTISRGEASKIIVKTMELESK